MRHQPERRASPPDRGAPPARRAALRALAILACVLALSLALPPPAVLGADPILSVEQALRLTDHPAPDVSPRVAILPSGNVAVAWQRPDAAMGHTRLLAAELPGGEPVTLDRVPTGGEPVPLDLVGGAEPHVAWARPEGSGAALLGGAWGRPAGVLAELDAPAGALALGMGGSGAVWAAWAEGDTLHVWSGEGSATVWPRVTAEGTVGDVTVAVAEGPGAPEEALLAWTVRDAEGLPLGVYVADAAAIDAPLLVAPGGAAPRAVMGPSGAPTLLWLGEGGLYACTREGAWGEAVLVAPGASDWATAAVTADDVGRVHAAWVADGGLWWADSADWQRSRRWAMPAPDGEVVGLAIAVHDGTLHAAWSAAPDGGAPDVYYAAQMAPVAPLAVRHPDAGDVVSRPTSAWAAVAPSPVEMVEVSFWLQEVGAEVTGNEGLPGPLRHLGLDRDGGDGWSAPLDPSTLDADAGYRVVAFGVDAAGRTAVGVGGTFRAVPAGLPWALLRGPGFPAARGSSALQVLLGDAGPEAHLELSFSPLDDGRAPGDATPGDGEAVLLGDYRARSTERLRPRWETLPFDSRALADGDYLATVSVAGGGAAATLPVRVENVTPPRVEIVRPLPGEVVEGELTAEVAVEDPAGAVQRVAFYLERAADPAGATGVVGRRIWLGTDSDGSDGWGVRQPLDASLDGDAWVLHVVAIDDRGLVGVGRSPGPFSLLGRRRPVLRFATPSGGAPVRGVAPVTVHAAAGHEHVEGVELFVGAADGSLRRLGEMAEAELRWTLTWDTTAWPDGEYRLLAVGRSTAGRAFTAWSRTLRVANRVMLRFAEPTADAELAGRAPVAFHTVPGGEAPTAVHLYCATGGYAAGGGDLVPIGVDRDGSDGWSVAWDTAGVLDGAYELVALAIGEHGGTHLETRPVSVRNEAPHVALEGPGADEVAGEVALGWRVEHPLGPDTLVSVEYSPDGGGHWLEVAAELPPDEPYTWDTRRFPDSDAALVRVTASDGPRRGRAVSAPFRANNVNEAPVVSLLAPAPGQPHAREVHVAWQAWDPDGDAVSARLEYRRGDGEWTLLAEPEASTTAYRWDASDLPPADDYSLRVTARDPRGAVGVDVVAGIRLVANSRPSVQLLAPRGDVRLRDQAVVLWSTYDAEDDPLRIDLYYSDNGGQTWLPLAQDLPNTGYYVWQFSFLPSGGDYRLRVVARDGTWSGLDESDSLFVIGTEAPPELALHRPAPGDALAGWALLSWHLEGAPLGETRVDLDLLPEGGEWAGLEAGLPNDGVYLWDTSPFPDGAYDLRVTVIDADGRVVSQATRAIRLANSAGRPAAVELLEPLGGEVWWGRHLVRWRAENLVGDDPTATLYLSADGGGTWSELATVDARAGAFLWDTREAGAPGSYLLRVAVTDDRSTAHDRTAGLFHLVGEGGHPPLASFIGLGDDGAVSYGSRILWTVDGADGGVLRTTLALSDDGGRTWGEVAATDAHIGAQSLADLQCGQEYRARLRATDGVYLVEAEAAVQAPNHLTTGCPELYIDAPIAGEVWSGFQQVLWRVVHRAELEVSIDIALSGDGGATWVPVVEGFPNTGIYDLDTRAWPNGLYRLRLRAHSPEGSTVRVGELVRFSNAGNAAPVVSFVSPTGGEVWSGAREAHWFVYDPADGDHVARLSYSLDGGATWREVAGHAADDRSVVWDSVGVPNSDAVWLRVDIEGRFRVQEVLGEPIVVYNPDAPTIALRVPGGPVWTGVQRLEWSARGAGTEPIVVELEVSSDAGRTWRTLARDLPPEGSYLWDASSQAEGARLLVRAWARSGDAAALDAMERPATVRRGAQRLGAEDPYAAGRR